MHEILRNQYLQAMGIQRWMLRDRSLATGTALDAPPSTHEFGMQSETAVAAWQLLKTTVSQCTQCELHKTRTQTVFGTGNQRAEWLVIGEAPGADEDRQGEPFVGRAGQLLNEMLRAIKFRREDVYIANILKCRPPNNRDPQSREITCCETYLLQQIELIKPRIILAVGRIAAQNLLKTDTPIGRLRGQVHMLAGTAIPLVVTYHPAYLLRTPSDKRRAWEDLKLALRCKAAQT